MNAGTRVKVTGNGDYGYHYAPVGAVGTVVEAPRPADVTVKVRLDGPLTSTAGNEHPDGLTQIIPLDDLVEVL